MTVGYHSYVLSITDEQRIKSQPLAVVGGTLIIALKHMALTICVAGRGYDPSAEEHLANEDADEFEREVEGGKQKVSWSQRGEFHTRQTADGGLEAISVQVITYKYQYSWTVKSQWAYGPALLANAS